MEDCSYCRWKHMLLHRCIKLRISVCRDAASFHSIAHKTDKCKVVTLAKGRKLECPLGGLAVARWSNLRVKYYSYNDLLHETVVKNLEHPISRTSLGYLSTGWALLSCWSRYEENDRVNKLSRFWFEKKATLILSCSVRLLFKCFTSFSHTFLSSLFSIFIWNKTQSRRQSLTSLVLVQLQQNCTRKIWSNYAEKLSLNGSLLCRTFASCLDFC